MPQNRTPSYDETVQTVADALVEVRRDNDACHPNDKTNEETFVIGAIRLYMSEENAPQGVSMQSMSSTVKTLASQWMCRP